MQPPSSFLPRVEDCSHASPTRSDPGLAAQGRVANSRSRQAYGGAHHHTHARCKLRPAPSKHKPSRQGPPISCSCVALLRLQTPLPPTPTTDLNPKGAIHPFACRNVYEAERLVWHRSLRRVGPLHC